MGGGELHPDAGLTLGYHRVVEPDHVNALGQQFFGELLRKRCLVEHDGHNRMLARLDVKAGRGHLLAEILCIPLQPVPQFGGLGEHVQHRNGSPHDGWRQCIGKQVRP